MSGIENALLASVPYLLSALTAALLGALFSFWWNSELKKRETNLATLKKFHELYSEFFAVWKLWECYIEIPDAFPNVDRWALLDRACAAEGGMEAILINLSAKYRSSPASLEALGQFRQVFKQLRQSIRTSQPLDWWSSEHPEYLAFKKLFPAIAYMIQSGHEFDGVLAECNAKAWLDVADNRHETWLLKIALSKL